MTSPDSKLFRNQYDVLSDQGVWIDTGALWELKDGILVLVDEDEYQTHAPSNDLFEEVK